MNLTTLSRYIASVILNDPYIEADQEQEDYNKLCIRASNLRDRIKNDFKSKLRYSNCKYSFVRFLQSAKEIEQILKEHGVTIDQGIQEGS